MKLNRFFKEYIKPKEVRVIGRQFYVKDKLVEVMGFYRTGRKLQLFLLEYDEERINREEDYENELYYDEMITNREQLHRDIERHYQAVTQDIQQVIIGEKVFEVCESGLCKANLSEYENTLIFTEFFKNGWTPKDIGKMDLDDCYLCSIMFDDKFSKIPNFDENTKFTFTFREDFKTEFIEKDIVLDTEKEYDEPIYFDENHWVYINDVYVFDIIEDTMKKFDDPKFTQGIDPKELEEAKRNTMNGLFQTCPKGKGFFCVEYENDTDSQLNFQSKKWLESEVERKNSSTIFMARPDKKEGKNGRVLRADIIGQPVDLNDKTIETEIFSIHKFHKKEDITI